jgi:hypothetical protein
VNSTSGLSIIFSVQLFFHYFAAVLKIVLALIGKMCVAAAFAVAYNYSAELFPTVVRNIGTGMGSFSARIGGLLAPQVHAVVGGID